MINELSQKRVTRRHLAVEANVFCVAFDHGLAKAAQLLVGCPQFAQTIVIVLSSIVLSPIPEDWKKSTKAHALPTVGVDKEWHAQTVKCGIVMLGGMRTSAWSIETASK